MKLFVGSLPYEVTEDTLREIFEKVGSVASAKVINDRYTGRSRGFGFVEMSTSEEADAAIEQLDGTEVMGRTIAVKKANDSERGGGGDGERRHSAPRHDRGERSDRRR